MAPLLAIGQLTAISKNYDVIDIYDATAAYVIDFPVNAILSRSPPNPLPSLVVSPGTLSNGWGLSYLHALASVLANRSPIETQPVVFGLMHALLVPAAFIFARRMLGFSPWLATLAAVLGVHGMLLSLIFIGLGNHTAILALLPLTLVSSFLAIDRRGAREIALAGVMSQSTVPTSCSACHMRALTCGRRKWPSA